MTLCSRLGSQRTRHKIPPRFTVGQHVLLTRDLPTQRANSEGTIRGLTPTPEGINYAVRFNDGMRVVHERDLRNSTLNDADANPTHREC